MTVETVRLIYNPLNQSHSHSHGHQTRTIPPGSSLVSPPYRLHEGEWGIGNGEWEMGAPPIVQSHRLTFFIPRTGQFRGGVSHSSGLVTGGCLFLSVCLLLPRIQSAPEEEKKRMDGRVNVWPVLSYCHAWLVSTMTQHVLGSGLFIGSEWPRYRGIQRNREIEKERWRWIDRQRDRKTERPTVTGSLLCSKHEHIAISPKPHHTLKG